MTEEEKKAEEAKAEEARKAAEEEKKAKEAKEAKERDEKGRFADHTDQTKSFLDEWGGLKTRHPELFAASGKLKSHDPAACLFGDLCPFPHEGV